MNEITALVIGAGDRGFTYSRLGKGRLKPVAVADPSEKRRKTYCEEFGIGNNMSFKNFQEAFDKGKIADICIITTPDELHYIPAGMAIENGYDILLEKPISNRKEDIQSLLELNKIHKRFVGICHVLRFAPFYKKLKEITASGILGDICTIEHIEGIGWWHFAHSYVRGNWRNITKSSPTILAKSSHDLDLLLWYTERKALNVASFGGLYHFRKENAPDDKPERCVKCSIEEKCPYSAKKLYLDMNIKGWPVSVITDDLNYEGRLKAIEEGPYGRCVYNCDNDAVDHQVVIVKFEGNITASFTMSAFTNPGRKIRIMGTMGEAGGDGKTLYLTDFRTGNTEVMETGYGGNNIDSGHGGGDKELTNAFLNAIEKSDSGLFHATLEESAQSHFLAFAAEQSRLSGKVVSLENLK